MGFVGLLALAALVSCRGVQAQQASGSSASGWPPREAPTADEVRLASAVEYYDVPGTTIDEVIDRLNGLRLEGPEGPPSQGLTRYHIRPEWRSVPSGGACRVTRLSLRVDITVTLPRWPGVEERPALEQERWSVIDEAIRTHEYRHHEIVVEAADRLAETLRGMQARGCGNLERAVESALSVADGRLKEAHAEFDRETPSRLSTGGVGR